MCWLQYLIESHLHVTVIFIFSNSPVATRRWTSWSDFSHSEKRQVSPGWFDWDMGGGMLEQFVWELRLQWPPSLGYPGQSSYVLRFWSLDTHFKWGSLWRTCWMLFLSLPCPWALLDEKCVGFVEKKTWNIDSICCDSCCRFALIAKSLITAHWAFLPS